MKKCRILWISQWIQKVWVCTAKRHIMKNLCMLNWTNISETVMFVYLLITLLVPIPPIIALNKLFSSLIQIPLQPSGSKSIYKLNDRFKMHDSVKWEFGKQLNLLLWRSYHMGGSVSNTATSSSLYLAPPLLWHIGKQLLHIADIVSSPFCICSALQDIIWLQYSVIVYTHHSSSVYSRSSMTGFSNSPVWRSRRKIPLEVFISRLRVF